MKQILCWVAVLALVSASGAGADGHGKASAAPVAALEIRILSTMVTDTRGIGEWGFAALVEADGFRVLYDTGYRPETVLSNAKDLSVDLGGVEDVVLSHNHGDHTGGLLTLRRALMEAHPKALSRTHVGAGLFDPREFPPGLAKAGFHFPDMNEVRAEYEGLGGSVTEHTGPVALAPGVWLTGPVPRVHPEKNFGAAVKVLRDGSWEIDILVEDSALVVHTTKGLVILTGCGHAGVVNIVDYARTLVPDVPVHAVIGGLHLFSASDETLAWTGDTLAERGVQNLIGAHCTGIHATHVLAERLGLAREAAVVGAVGAGFSLENGIEPLGLAR